MKLYYKSGACSLASHIALRELDLSFEAISVDLATKKTVSGGDFLQVTSKGQVPALELDNGGGVLTEGAAILQYIADLKPEAGLAPANGTLERYRLQEWLSYISGTLHGNFSPLFNQAADAAAKDAARTILARKFDYVTTALQGRDYLLGQFNVADAYLYVVLGWAPRVGIDLARWPQLVAYRANISARPAVQAALKAEGLN